MSSVWLPVSSPDAKRDLIIKEEGIYVYEDNGTKYLDGNSGLWNVPLGYSNERIKKAIVEQMQKSPFVNPELFSNQAAGFLAETILSILPLSIEKVFFTCTGSESTELAIKLVRKFHQLLRNYKKTNIAIFSQSYHGNYYGAMSASTYEGELRSGYAPLLEGFIELPLPFVHEKGDIRERKIELICTQIKEILESSKNILAGILIEPILGSAGVIPLPKSLIKWIDKFAFDNNIIVVFDEISTGLGRSGKMFAFDHYEIIPDLILMSKGLNNGYLPIGAVAISKKICRAFRMRREILFHLSTQNGNPLCCAAAIETILQIKENNFRMVSEVQEKGKLFFESLKHSLKDYNQVYDIRGEGLMTAIELVEKDKETPLNPNKLDFIVRSLKNQGLLCSANYKKSLISCIYFFLPYIISKEEINKVTQIIETVLCNICNLPLSAGEVPGIPYPVINSQTSF